MLSGPPRGGTSDLIEFPHTTSPRFCPYRDSKCFCSPSCSGLGCLEINYRVSLQSYGWRRAPTRDYVSQQNETFMIKKKKVISHPPRPNVQTHAIYAPKNTLIEWCVSNLSFSLFLMPESLYWNTEVWPWKCLLPSFFSLKSSQYQQLIWSSSSSAAHSVGKMTALDCNLSFMIFIIYSAPSLLHGSLCSDIFQ